MSIVTVWGSNIASISSNIISFDGKVNLVGAFLISGGFSIVFKRLRKNKRKKKVGKRVTLCCTVGYKWVTVMDCVKFEFNDIISLYTKNDSERWRFVNVDILYYIFYICITYYRKKTSNKTQIMFLPSSFIIGRFTIANGINLNFWAYIRYVKRF